MGHRLSEYQAALDFLFVRTTGQWRLGLERMAALLAALGNPHDGLRVIHVAGTNGKGSVCAMLDAILRARGFAVARYTSPHLVDFRERVVVNGAPVPERVIVEFIDRWTPEIERTGATFFEATTAMALVAFAEARPDVVILEVGLGGRLDATNMVNPMVSVVTNIGMDHTEYLGTTWRAIAREKAGIFKPDRAAVIGEADAVVRRELAAHARSARAAPVRTVWDEVSLTRHAGSTPGVPFGSWKLTGAQEAIEFTLSLPGEHQGANAATALTVADALPAPYHTPMHDAAAALAGVRIAGRFQFVDKFIFDVAHNRDGAAVCAQTLAELGATLPRPRVALLCVLRDKDWPGMMEELAPVVDEFVLTVAPTSPLGREWNPDEPHALAVARGWRARVERDFDAALEVARMRGATVLVTGSFHTVGDAMIRLHVSPFGD